MAEPTIPSENLLVAGRGEGALDGLHLATERQGQWRLRLLDPVVQLAALCGHPHLAVAYGLSGRGRGEVIAWDVSEVVGGGPAIRLAEGDCLGDIPCDLAVDPDGRVLIAANYGFEGSGGSLTVWRLDDRGVPVDPAVSVALSGSGVHPSRQGVPHPHQVVFHEGVLYVPDLGAECVRRYAFDPELRELEPIHTPSGTGPRHMVVIAASDTTPRVVLSGELAGTIALGRLDPTRPDWQLAHGSTRTGATTGRTDRNYPGDVKASADGRFAYFANRGFDTISAFALERSGPRLIGEVDAGVAWPQHILVRDDHLLVAGWDGSAVMRLPLVAGVPTAAELAFECGGAGWLLTVPIGDGIAGAGDPSSPV